MIIEKTNISDRHRYLMEAFRDTTFQEDLKKVMKELKEWVSSWIKGMEELDPRISNVYSIESRIKGEKTFEEKLFRKDYIHDWDVYEDKIENQKYIMRNLTDLIGLRINCFFVEYEKRFYDYLWETQDAQRGAGFDFNFNENIKQKNGNVIYKFSGTYKDTYHFEIQIKSIVHNVWGEVEHKTVYKNPSYDGFFEKKKQISRTLHDVMIASDRELYTLFNMKETEDQLLRSLFFIKTRDFVAKQCNTTVLGEHYNSYFQAFPDITPIKEYLVQALSGKEQKQDEIKVETTEFYLQMKEAVIKSFPGFYLSCLYHIDITLHRHESFDSFLIYFLEHVIKEENDDFDKDLQYGFTEGEDEEHLERDPYQDYLRKIDNILGTNILKKKDNVAN